MLEATFLHWTENRRFMQANGVLSELVLMARTEILETLDELLRMEGQNCQLRLDPIYPPPFEVVLPDLNNDIE